MRARIAGPVGGTAIAALTFTLTVPLGSGASVNASEGAEVEVRTVSIDVTVGPEQDTTCRVVADLYVPPSATAEHPQPAVLTTHGFGGSKESQAGVGKMLSEQDYVVLAYSGLGFGGTQCKITLDHPEWDGRAASQLVDYLAGTKADVDGNTLDMVEMDAAGDPSVGMVGGSYGGQVQFAAAATDSRIDAIVPMVTWNDLSYSLAPNHTGEASDAGVHKRIWTDLFAVSGVLAGLQHAPGDPRRLLGCPNFVDWICPALIETNLKGYGSAETVRLMREASVASYVSRVEAPTLLMQGEDDTLFDLREAVDTYRALDAQGTPVRMVWHWFGHSGSEPAPGEIDLSGERDPTTTYLGRRILDWFGYWLRADHSHSLGPEFAYFRDWIEYDGSLPAGAEPAYGVANSYPVGDSRTFFLSGDGSLTPDQSAIVDGARDWANLPGGIPTSYSEFPPEWDDIPPSDLGGTFASWTSEPLPSEVDTVGEPALDVRFTSPVAELTQRHGPGGQLVVFTKLYDVAPDGSVQLVHRLVSAVRVPDVRERVRIALPTVAHRWEQGHRIRVVLAASDIGYAGNNAVLPVEVRSTVADPPTLTLPVLP